MPRHAPGEGSITRRKDGRWQASLQVAGLRRTVYGKSRQEVAEKLRALQATAHRWPTTAPWPACTWRRISAACAYPA